MKRRCRPGRLGNGLPSRRRSARPGPTVASLPPMTALRPLAARLRATARLGPAANSTPHSTLVQAAAVALAGLGTLGLLSGSCSPEDERRRLLDQHKQVNAASLLILIELPQRKYS